MVTLQSVLEKDKERLLSRISGKEKQDVIKEVRDQLDRIRFEYNSREPGDALRRAADQMIQTAKSCAGLMDIDGEARIYGRKEYPQGSSDRYQKGERPSALFWFLFLSGLFCALLVLLEIFSRMSGESAGKMAGTLLASVMSAVLLFAAGIRLKRKKTVPAGQEEWYAEVPVDPQRVYQQLSGMVLTMDKSLEEVRAEEKIRERKELTFKSETADPLELDLMAQLLEDAYGRRETDEQAEELCSQLKYYLHLKQIDVVEYEAAGQSIQSPGSMDNRTENWFDMIPAYERGTIRPALVMNGTVLKKGLASNG